MNDEDIQRKMTNYFNLRMKEGLDALKARDIIASGSFSVELVVKSSSGESVSVKDIPITPMVISEINSRVSKYNEIMAEIDV